MCTSERHAALWLYAQAFIPCLCAPASVCAALHMLHVYTQPCVSPIVLSGSDRVSTTVRERRDSTEKIAALQLFSLRWLLFIPGHMESYELTDTARQSVWHYSIT